MNKLTLIFCLICLISISQPNDFHLERLNISISEDIFKSKMIDISNGHFLTQNSKLYSFSNTAISEISFPEGLKIENFVFENKQQGMIVGKVEKNQLPFFMTNVSEHKENPNDYNLYFEKVYSGHHLLPISDTKKWIVGYTQNGGLTWVFRELKTNFDVSSCNVENNVYYITTRGPEDHLDGDIWKIETQKNRNEVNDIIDQLDYNNSYDVNIRNKILCSLYPYFNRIELVVYHETFVPL
jgi:hypothetical protein